MDELTIYVILLALLSSFVAGLVDAIVGGGGLVQLPLLLILFPDHRIPLLLGTNKVAMMAGTVVASISYARKLALPWRFLTWGIPIALLGSFGGSWLATIVPPSHIKPVVFGLLLAVGLYTLLKPHLGTNAARTSELTARDIAIGSLLSGVIGAYDGFLGPGTGSFLIFGLVMLLKMDFLSASGSAKWLNLATNFGAIVVFAATANVWWQLALPMAVANIAGGYCGASLSLSKGARFVRAFFLIVVSALLIRLGWDIW
jgi:hypothetical protein